MRVEHHPQDKEILHPGMLNIVDLHKAENLLGLNDLKSQVYFFFDFFNNELQLVCCVILCPWGPIGLKCAFA